MTQDYEIIIVGGGPAGLTAGIYASRARRKTVLLEKHGTGGQMALTWEVENYPGVEKISGYDLGQIMERQARSFGLEIRSVEVTGVATDGPLHRVEHDGGRTHLPLARDHRRRAEQPPRGSRGGRADRARGVVLRDLRRRLLPGRAGRGGRRGRHRARGGALPHALREPGLPRPPQERVPGHEAAPGAHRGGAEDRTGARRGRGAHRGQGRRDRPGAEEPQERGREPHRRRGRLHLRRHDAEHGIPAKVSSPSTPRVSSRRTRTSRRRSPGSSPPATCRAKVLRQISTAVGEGALAATMADHHLSH